MLTESQWTPDISDCKTPSAEDIQQLLQLSGMHENPNLKDEKDNVLYWFANTLLTDHWPLVDGVLRQAGPTQMRIEHTQIVNKPGYRINHPEKLAAIQFIIKDLLEKDIIAPANSPYSSPALIVPKKHKPGETDVHKKWRFVSDYRALNAVTISDTYKPPPIDMLLTATAGVVVHPLRIAINTLAPAPICPSIDEYAAEPATRVKKNIAARAAKGIVTKPP
jgi:hypothetical protein